MEAGAGGLAQRACMRTSLHAQLGGCDLLLLLPCCSFGIFGLLLLLFLGLLELFCLRGGCDGDVGRQEGW